MSMPTVFIARVRRDRRRCAPPAPRCRADGTLVPGQRLLQTALSEELGVSRTPLREALRVLQHEGFVEVVDGNKTLAVVELSIDDLLEVYELREVVDGLAARLAAERGIGGATSAALQRALAGVQGALDPHDLTRRASAHADLHTTIAEASGNRHVIAQIPMIRFTAQMGTRDVQTLDDGARSQILTWLAEGDGNHHAIVRAIERGEAGEAERVARLHIRHTIESIVERRSAGAAAHVDADLR